MLGLFHQFRPFDEYKDGQIKTDDAFSHWELDGSVTVRGGDKPNTSTQSLNLTQCWCRGG